MSANNVLYTQKREVKSHQNKELSFCFEIRGLNLLQKAKSKDANQIFRESEFIKRFPFRWSVEKHIRSFMLLGNMKKTYPGV